MDLEFVAPFAENDAAQYLSEGRLGAVLGRGVCLLHVDIDHVFGSKHTNS